MDGFVFPVVNGGSGGGGGSSLSFGGSIKYAELPATPSGDNASLWWNIEDEFITDARFSEGAGKKIAAGSNVGIAKKGDVYKYDVIGTFIDLSVLSGYTISAEEYESLFEVKAV